MSFFSYYGNTWFSISDTEQVYINDITKFTTITKKYREDPNLLLDYLIKDGESPHMLSDRLYGSVNYWWVVMLINSKANYYEDWPLDDDQLMRYLDKKYPYTDYNTTVHHYEDPIGSWTDPDAIAIVKGITKEIAIDQYDLSPVTIFQYEQVVNDKKRVIVMVDPDYISQLLSDLKEQFS